RRAERAAGGAHRFDKTDYGAPRCGHDAVAGGSWRRLVRHAPVPVLRNAAHFGRGFVEPFSQGESAVVIVGHNLFAKRDAEPLKILLYIRPKLVERMRPVMLDGVPLNKRSDGIKVLLCTAEDDATTRHLGLAAQGIG